MRRLGTLRRLTLADRVPWKVRPKPTIGGVLRLHYRTLSLPEIRERFLDRPPHIPGRLVEFPIWLNP